VSTIDVRRVEDGTDGPRADYGLKGLDEQALRGPASTTSPIVSEMRALIFVLAAYEAKPAPLFGRIAYVVCSRLLKNISNDANVHRARVKDAYDRLCSSEGRNGRNGRTGRNGLDGLKAALRALVESEDSGEAADALMGDVERRVSDVEAIAALIREVLGR
jgi:hypothetical protein